MQGGERAVCGNRTIFKTKPGREKINRPKSMRFESSNGDKLPEL